MRQSLKTSILVSFFTCFLNLFCTHAQQIIPLSATWEFRKAGDSSWNPATVPGTVHTDLYALKKIPDPFYRLNEKDLQWIDKEDWEYRTVFSLDPGQLACKKLFLVFKGLDTYADVYINGVKMLVADNMFRIWKADILPRLRPGVNSLRVYFHSPVKEGTALYKSLPFRVPVSDNDQASPKVSVFTRKAGYHYGWDWGPRFVTSGIWRPVFLESMGEAAIGDLFIKQKTLTTRKAGLEARIEVESMESGIRQVEVVADGIKAPLYSSRVHLEKGMNTLVCSFTLPDPELWWPNGYGAQKLYTFHAILKNGSAVLAEKKVRQGMRTVEVVQESGTGGNSFKFRVNGVDIFMKGANYIPQDNFLPSVSRDRYERVLNTAVLSHMNMLRVWGGGIYENDLFYDLCDEKGIMVWQDFMFACAMQPPLEALKQNIYEEAVENVKRLRSHPSLALWCGNNEDIAFISGNYWGDAKGAFRNRQDSMTLINTYKEIFHSILPAVVKAWDDDHFYWSSSPQSSNYSERSTNSKNSGDIHFWDVWGNGKPIETYLDNIGPFMSEYGFQSFPDLETVQKFSLPEDADINSTVLKSHQRSYVGNGAILAYMKKWYKVPAAFKDFLYTGQVLQAEAIKLAIEAHRRAKPFCMGSLYWQIDDCWPAASWSSMDYFGHWKALQYEAKRAFEPVLISPVVRGDSLQVFVISDKLSPFDAVIRVRLKNFSGKVLMEMNSPVKIPENTSTRLYAKPLKDVLKNEDRHAVYAACSLIVGGRVLSENLQYFENPKDLALQKAGLKFSLVHTGSAYTLSLLTPVLAKNVSINTGDGSVILSDNFFDLQPGEVKKIFFNSVKSLTDVDIRLVCLNNLDI